MKWDRTQKLNKPPAAIRVSNPSGWRQLTKVIVLGMIVVGLLAAGQIARAQTSETPFTVSNPKHKKWPADQARRIYFTGCELVARTVRPEKPPRILPKFALVLGANVDELVWDGSEAVLHLKEWNSQAFSEGVVTIASRAILKQEELNNISHQVLVSSEASVSVADLRQGQ